MWLFTNDTKHKQIIYRWKVFFITSLNSRSLPQNKALFGSDLLVKFMILHKNAYQWSGHFLRKRKVPSWRGSWDESFGTKNRRWEYLENGVSSLFRLGPPMAIHCHQQQRLNNWGTGTHHFGPLWSWLADACRHWPASSGRSFLGRFKTWGERKRERERERESDGGSERGWREGGPPECLARERAARNWGYRRKEMWEEERECKGVWGGVLLVAHLNHFLELQIAPKILEFQKFPPILKFICTLVPRILCFDPKF